MTSTRETEDEPEATPPEAPSEALWELPAPLGLGGARESMSGTAAPLLAGISIVLVGVVAQVPESFRWPGWSICLLTAATVLLVACVQLGFVGRAYLYSASEVKDWRPDIASEEPWIKTFLKNRQIKDFARWQQYATFSALSYNVGLGFLAAAVGVTVAPPDADAKGTPLMGDVTDLRWSAMGMACFAGLVELAWSIRSYLQSSKNSGGPLQIFRRKK